MSEQETVVENRFEVDHEGLKLQMKSIPPFRVVQELISNAFDEDSATRIECTIEPEGKKTLITVEDDGDGFEDPRDIYTMYKYSKKRADPSKIGRFNLGEKQFFALAEYGCIITKNLGVVFEGTKRITTNIKRDDGKTGTKIHAVMDWSGEDRRDILLNMHRIIVPENKVMIVNGNAVHERKRVKIFEIPLWTLVENPDTKILTRAKKVTMVELVEKQPNKRAWLYELGVPVVKLMGNISWDVNVMQKIPLSTSRNSVTESWLKDLYSGVLDNSYDIIDDKDSGAGWIHTGLSGAGKETVKNILVKQYGTDKLYIPASNDRQANEKVLETGGDFIKPNTIDGETKKRLIELNVISKASETFATKFSDSKKVEPTKQMELFANVVKKIAVDVIGTSVDVQFIDAKDSNVGATYGNKTVNFNVGLLGQKFFDEFGAKQIGLIIHELSHHSKKESCLDVSHLRMDFINELQRIGGMIAVKGIQYWVNRKNE